MFYCISSHCFVSEVCFSASKAILVSKKIVIFAIKYLFKKIAEIHTFVS